VKEKNERKNWKKIAKWERKLEEMKKSPLFNNNEYERKLLAIEELNIPITWFSKLVIAKSIIKTNKKLQKVTRYQIYFQNK